MASPVQDILDQYKEPEIPAGMSPVQDILDSFNRGASADTSIPEPETDVSDIISQYSTQTEPEETDVSDIIQEYGQQPEPIKYPALDVPAVKNIKGAMQQPPQAIQGIGEAFGQIPERFQAGKAQWDTDQELAKSVLANDQAGIEQGITESKQRAAEQMNMPVADDFWEKAITGAAQMVPGLWYGMIKPQAIGAGGGAAVGAIGGLPGAAAGAKIGSKLATIEGARRWYMQGVGDFYASYREEGLDHDSARIAAMIGAAPYAGIELLQFSRLLPKSIQPAAFQVAWKDTVKAGVGAIMRRGGMQYIARVAEESGEEGLQEIVKELTSDFGKDMSQKYGRTNLERRGIQNAIKKGFGAVLESIPAMTLLGMGGSVADTGIALNRRAKITNIAQQKDAMGTLFGTDKVQQIDDNTLLVDFGNGRGIQMNFKPDVLDDMQSNPEAFMDSIKENGKAGRRAVAKAIEAHPGDITAQVQELSKEWLPQANTVRDTELTDSDGNTINVGAIINLENGWATKGAAAHEIWHALKNVANVTEQENAELERVFGSEEAQAYAFERWEDRNPILKKVDNFVDFMFKGFRKTAEDPETTANKIRQEIIEGLEKATETYPNVTELERARIDEQLGDIQPIQVTGQIKKVKENKDALPVGISKTLPMGERAGISPEVDGEIRGEGAPQVTEEAQAGQVPPVEEQFIPPQRESSQSGQSTENADNVETPAGEADLSAIGISNAETAKRRETLGMEQRPSVAKRSNAEALRIAEEEIKANPNAVNDLMDELRSNPERSLNDIENAMLTIETTRLANETDRYNEEAANAKTDEIRHLALANMEAAKEAEREMILLNEQPGTATARGLQARKAMLNRDFSLANMKRQAEKANGNKPISKETEAELEKISKQLADAQKEIESLKQKSIRTSAEYELEKLKAKSSKRGKIKSREEILAGIRKQAGLPESVAFSVEHTPTKQDKVYLKAVKEGRLDDAQKMVDDEAKKKGWIRKLFHGSTYKDQIRIFRSATHLGTEQAARDRLKAFDGVSGTIYKTFVNIDNPLEVPDLGLFSAFDMANEIQGRDGVLILVNDLIPRLSPKDKLDIGRRLGWRVDVGDFTDQDIIDALMERYDSLNKKGSDVYEYIYGDYRDIRGVSEKNPELMELAVNMAKDAGYDGMKYTNEVEDIGSTTYIAFSPSQIKSADPVTYDDQGNVIPLSERFNPEKEDIRFSVEQLSDKDRNDIFVAFEKFNQTIAAIRQEQRSIRDNYSREFELDLQIDKARNRLNAELAEIKLEFIDVDRAIKSMSEKEIRETLFVGPDKKIEDVVVIRSNRMLTDSEASSLFGKIEKDLPQRTVGLKARPVQSFSAGGLRHGDLSFGGRSVGVNGEGILLINLSDSSKFAQKEFGEDVDYNQSLIDSFAGEKITDKRRLVPSAKSQPKLLASVFSTEQVTDRPTRQMIVDLSRYYVSQGDKDVNSIVSKIHADLVEIFPDVKADDILLLLSNPGKQSQQKIEKDLMESKAELKSVKAAAKTATDPEQKELAKLHKRLEKSIARLEEKIKNKDFSKKTKKEIAYDQKAMELKLQEEKLKERYQEILFQAHIDNMTPAQRAWHETRNTLNAIKALVTSFDLSGIRRQGGWYAFTHPVMTMKTMRDLKGVVVSELADYMENEALKQRKNYRLYRKYRLGITEMGTTSAVWRKEEEYAFQKSIAGNIAVKIPGVKASQRSYVTYLNRIRADYFDLLSDKLAAKGQKLTDREYKAIADFVNDATGRAGLGKHENSAMTLATIFFSPRFVLSRFRIALGVNLVTAPNQVRKIIAQEYARYLTGLIGVIGLLSMAGDEPEEDPRSSAFGKIKIGKTYIDLMSGLQQPIVLMSRLVSGKRKTPAGTIRQERGPDAAFGASTLTTINQFVRSKLAPVPGALLSMITGKNYIGEEKKPWEIMAELPVPLLFKDIYEAMRVEGVPAGMALGAIAMMGESISTQEGKQEKSIRDLPTKATRAERRKQFGVALSSLDYETKAGKMDIKREYKGKPNIIRQKMKELNQRQLKRKRELKEFYLEHNQ